MGSKRVVILEAEVVTLTEVEWIEFYANYRECARRQLELEQWASLAESARILRSLFNYSLEGG